MENQNSEFFFEPYGDRVVVQQDAAETKTASGIIIPDTAKEVPRRGTIVAVGPGREDYEMSSQVGDRVLYGKYAGSEVEHEGVTYLLLRETDVYGKLK